MKKFFESIFNSISLGTKVSETNDTTPKPMIKETDSSFGYPGAIIQSPWYAANTYAFDGEKTPGELGAPVDIVPEHQGLRYRAYEANLKSDIVKIITGKFFTWVIGNGLKLQAEPNEDALLTEGISEDLSQFKTYVEARFKVFSSSKLSDFAGMENLHRRASEAFKTAFLSGDALIILRVINQMVKVQVIDGAEVMNPVLESKFYQEAKDRGNKIIHGIELDSKNQHVAYFVKIEGKDNLLYEFERIESKTKDGRLMAWMIYGDKHRSNHHRGIPKITAILEKVDKLDRYTEASVGGAEERAKIAFSIEHDSTSSGESPLVDAMRKTMGPTGEVNNPYSDGDKIGKAITRTTGKQAFNMPIGAKLNALDSKQEDNYAPFFDAVFMQISASIDVPPEVAMQKYSSNYSASRAAINGWGYIVEKYRKDFAFDFYQNFYKLWLEVEVLKEKIKSPSFLKACLQNDEFVIECFSGSKFTGLNMPHIDPLKEVKAIREMLGDQMKGQLPLISHERASEELNQGEWYDNFTKWKTETDIGKDIIEKAEELKKPPQTEEKTKIKEKI